MLPVIRLFVACWNGVPGTPADQYRLADITSIVFPKPGDAYPLRHPEFCFYTILTGGRGRHAITIRQRSGVAPSRVVWESRQGTIDFGSDPVAVIGLPLRMKNLEFAAPGQYEFVLVCDGAELEPPIYIEARV